MVRVAFQFTALAALVGVTTACGLTEKKFEKKVIKAQCQLYQECSATDFDIEYESLKDCEDAVETQNSTDLDLYDDCDFVRDEAKDCLKAIENLPCEAEEADYVDFMNSCYNVWVCDGVGTGDDDDDAGDDDDDDDDDTDT